MTFPQTPIKEIWVIDCTIYSLDYSDRLNALATATDPLTTALMAQRLGQHHNKQVYALNIDYRKMVPLQEANA